jgi:aryl-alcohol dehydrogenase-like predicted oxidoreductase
MSKPNGATPAGTTRYSKRLASGTAPGHFSEQHGLCMSSIGLGTYLGHWDERTDRMYQESIKRAIELGCNVIDSAINYRFQRSERSIGAALKQLFDSGKVKRDEIIVATKGGFFSFDGEPPPDASGWVRENLIRTGVARPEEIVDSHCMSPAYLEHELSRSLENLGLETIDIYYVHNPESQLDGVSREEFNRRVRAAFEFLERAAAEGRISFYGTATWNGYRIAPESQGYLALAEMEQAAREVGGADHHFRVIQLPHNLNMPEALTTANQTVDGEPLSPLEAASALGITVMCSASMHQARLSHDLPNFIAAALKGLTTDAQRAIQFVRSSPGVTTALVGMSQRSHVEENLMVARVSPAPIEEFLTIFGDHEEDISRAP